MAILCASCGLETKDPSTACEQCGGEPTLDGRYVLESIAGEGIVGVTYCARPIDGERRVAIKELSMRRLGSFKKQELFEREAEVLKQLHHPGVPAYIDDFIWGVGKHQAFYLVEEYIEGGTLREAMSARQSERQVLEWLESALEVLVYLHGRVPMVVHRDIKPENLMRRANGQVVLVDFGVVRDGVVGSGDATLVGTPGYMAPEQARGEAYPESDVFAVGVVASELLARERVGKESWRKALKRVGVRRPLYLGLKQIMRVKVSDRWTAQEALDWVRAMRRGDEEGARALPARVEPASLARQTELVVASSAGEGALSVRRESLFGMWSALIAVVVMGMPCLTVLFGFLNALVVLSLLCLGMILVVPFLRHDEEGSERS